MTHHLESTDILQTKSDDLQDQGKCKDIYLRLIFQGKLSEADAMDQRRVHVSWHSL